MYKSGHKGLCMLLSSPLVAVLLVMEFYFLSILYVLLVTLWCSIPDVDIHIKEYERLSFLEYSIRYWHWIPVVSLSLLIMSFFAKFVSNIPADEKSSIQHRGITHTLWFSLAFGFFVASTSALVILFLMGLDTFYEIETYRAINDILGISPTYIIPFMFFTGLSAVAFHCVGDILTPTGIHFLTTKNNYGFSLDQFLANNEVANRSSVGLGIISLGYSVLFGIYYGQINELYLIAGFIGLIVILIPLWLLFVRTRVGEWFYLVYDTLRGQVL